MKTISEFGAELKGFHIELVDKIARALRMRQEDEGLTELSFVAPGDLTIAYDIAAHQLLCADDGELRDPAELTCRPSRGYQRERDEEAKEYTAKGLDLKRAYLFLRERESTTDEVTEDIRLTRRF